MISALEIIHEMPRPKQTMEIAAVTIRNTDKVSPLVSPSTEVTMNCTPNAITRAPNTRFRRVTIKKLFSSLVKRDNVPVVIRVFTAPYVY
jgi:hypothetical protein